MVTKKRLFLAGVCTTLLLISGCGQDKGNAESTKTKATTEEVAKEAEVAAQEVVEVATESETKTAEQSTKEGEGQDNQETKPTEDTTEEKTEEATDTKTTESKEVIESAEQKAGENQQY